MMNKIKSNLRPSFMEGSNPCTRVPKSSNPTVLKSLVVSACKILAFQLIVTSALCQDISSATINWSVNHGFDLRSNSDFSYSGSFTTNGSNTVVWTQSNGAFVSTFTISSLEGSWTDVAANGTATYHIEFDNTVGTLKFERTAAGVFITIDFPKDDPQGSWLKFQVNAVSQGN